MTEPKDNNVSMVFVCPRRTDKSCAYYEEWVNDFCKHSDAYNMTGGCTCSSSEAMINIMTASLKSHGIGVDKVTDLQNTVDDLTDHNKRLKTYLYRINALSFMERIKFILWGSDGEQ